MNALDFTTAFTTDKSPEKVFEAVTNVRGWWSEEIEGNTAQLNDQFDYHYEEVHRCRIKLIEVIPNKKVVWLIEQNYFNFTEDKTEWTNTNPTFEITEKDGKTELRFTHFGLVPDYECFNICRDAWTNYIQNSLKKLIETGKGEPNATGKPQTENEKKLSKS
ncbi:SRPBCC domain-containing protein [Flavobacterium endoglycinae]|uniref:SRPBCC domain-containing protein n=1 Tax=Flavobacterium endoglycinae TaxID=2816357 RepID=A0ABX7QAZ6_9FLAO|nr:SRPBCC domain-containing protein [Flavobacterium endoglycinae]QSW88117.1 SRPBCC domain-containing protein [Flavobacterium endoglycinae]